MPYISVIVPIYNTEEFLPNCLESIQQQTLSDIEIICVDDASSDNSVEVVSEYAKRDGRIRLIRHEKNLGLGGARNTALRAAHADYIASVDSDDWIDPKMLNVLLDATDRGSFDVVNCGFETVNGAGEVLLRNSHGYREVDLAGDDVDIFYLTNPSFWNKLWRRSLFIESGIEFPNHLFYQDLATTPRVYAIADNLKIIPDQLYKYRRRKGSATQSMSDKNIIDYFRVFDILYGFLHKRGLLDAHIGNFVKMVDRNMAYHANNVLANDCDEDQKSQYLRHLLTLREGYLPNAKAFYQTSPSRIAGIIKASPQTRMPTVVAEPEVVPVSIVVKTILRPNMLERFLKSVGDYQRDLGVVFAEIIVGDDTPVDRLQANRLAISNAVAACPDLRVRHEIFPPDIGLSAGRNRMIDAAKQDYVLLCDDDFMLDPDSDVREALKLMAERNADIVGGWLKNRYDEKTGEYIYWGSVGRAIDLGEEWLVWLNEDENHLPEVSKSDYILNFFVAKRTPLLSVRWRDEMKVEEHSPFFYDFQAAGLSALYSKKFFARHTHEIGNNSLAYNSRRHDKETWEYYIRKSLSAMKKKRRTLLRWRPGQLVAWEIEPEENKYRPISIPLQKPVLEQATSIRRLTPRFENWFYGYYDTRSVSAEGDVALVQSCTALRRLPISTDKVEIAVAPLDGSGASEVIGETTAWCHQQGAHLQFIPGADRTAVWNVFDEDRREFGAVIHSLKDGTRRTLDRPISAISPEGTKAASLNFSRLFDYRPGYGMPHVADPFGEQSAPADDGLWIIDLESGEHRLAISLAELRDRLATGRHVAHRSGKWIINHVAFNPSGTQVFMLVRVFSDDAPFPTFSVVCDTDGSNLRQVFGFASHYHWTDDDRIVVSGSPNFTRAASKKIHVYEIDVRTLEHRVIGQDRLVGDGHCSWSPDRSLMLYDSYPKQDFPYRNLQVYDNATGEVLSLAWFFAEKMLHGSIPDTRCDLHPRWSPDGKTITFDSMHEGFRAVYAIDVAEVRDAFARGAAQLSEQDLTAWYKATTSFKAKTEENARARKVSERKVAQANVLAAYAQHVNRRNLRWPNIAGRFFNLRRDEVLLKRSRLFDAAWYRDQYPDVKRAGVAPEKHYLLHGAIEGRDPGPDFSTVKYLDKNKDVMLAGLNPLIHYLRYGHVEQREAPRRD